MSTILPHYKQILKVTSLPNTSGVYSIVPLFTDNYLQVSINLLNNFNVNNLKQYAGVFKSKRAAEELLRELAKQFNLCLKLCGLEKTQHGCFAYQLKQCYGACVQEEAADEYNERVSMALLPLRFKSWPYAGETQVAEKCEVTRREVVHYIDNWVHCGTTVGGKGMRNFLPMEERAEFNYDEYRIIVGYLSERE